MYLKYVAMYIVTTIRKEHLQLKKTVSTILLKNIVIKLFRRCKRSLLIIIK